MFEFFKLGKRLEESERLQRTTRMSLSLAEKKIKELKGENEFYKAHINKLKDDNNDLLEKIDYLINNLPPEKKNILDYKD